MTEPRSLAQEKPDDQEGIPLGNQLRTTLRTSMTTSPNPLDFLVPVSNPAPSISLSQVVFSLKHLPRQRVAITHSAQLATVALQKSEKCDVLQSGPFQRNGPCSDKLPGVFS